jgi:hypothetical protein
MACISIMKGKGNDGGIKVNFQNLLWSVGYSSHERN